MSVFATIAAISSLGHLHGAPLSRFLLGRSLWLEFADDATLILENSGAVALIVDAEGAV